MTGEKIPQFFIPQGNAQHLHVSKDMRFGTPDEMLFEAQLKKGVPTSNETVRMDNYNTKGTKRTVTFNDGSVWTKYNGSSLDCPDYSYSTYYDAATGLTYSGETSRKFLASEQKLKYDTIQDTFNMAAYDKNSDGIVGQGEIYNRNEIYDE